MSVAISHRSGLKTSTYAVAALAYLAATVGLAHSSNYNQGLLLVAAVFSILALSLDLVAGMLGLYSTTQTLG